MILPPSFVPDESVMTGVGACVGIAIGPACVYSRQSRRVPIYQVSEPKSKTRELVRFNEAKELIRKDLYASKQFLPPDMQSQAAIIDAHMMLLDDPILLKSVSNLINSDGLNAEQAVLKTVEKYSSVLKKVQDAYISARTDDLALLGQALIDALMGHEAGKIQPPPPGSILVVLDISPTEIINIAQANPAGLVTERGGHTSHTAIMAQAVELPAVVGAKGLTDTINNGDMIIIDGRTGHIIIQPDQDTLNFYRTRKQTEKDIHAEIVRCAHMPAITLDDRRIEVLGNLELMEEVPAILSYGGEGIGLYRTEFMYLTCPTPPTEDDLYETYKRVLEIAAPHPVTLRTLDLGYDKILPTGNRVDLEVKMPNEYRNKALGLRGIRFSLHHKTMFKTQLRAILRAAVFGHARLMLPMISGLDELRRSRS
ncbi:MAG: phosphoenolpyruvate--protein phosphotransferase, partial [Candidatus Adiutrix sp.]